MSDTEASADEVNRDMETEEESAVDTEEESGDHQEASPKLKKTPPAVSKKSKQAAKKAATSSKAASSGDSSDGKMGKKPYEEMVLNAVKELKSRTGSSRAAILSYMKGAYNLGVEDKVVGFHVSASIKRGLAKGHLKHATEAGKGKNCFKLDEKGLELLKKTTANDKAKSKPKAKKVEKKKTPSKSGSSKPKAKSKKEVVPELKKSSSVTAKNKLKASASRRSSIATPVRVMTVTSKGGRKSVPKMQAAEPKSKSGAGTKKSNGKDSASAKKASKVKEVSKKTSKEASKKVSKPSDTKAKSTANGKTKKSVETTPPSKAKSASKKKATKK